MRVWKEYFASLISKKKDYYGFEKDAEDNEDYPNILSLKLSRENEKLREELKQKMKIVA